MSSHMVPILLHLHQCAAALPSDIQRAHIEVLELLYRPTKQDTLVIQFSLSIWASVMVYKELEICHSKYLLDSNS